MVRAAAVAAAMAAVAPMGAAAAEASPWWSPLGLRGVALSGVAANGGTITVRTGAGITLASRDRGAHFAPVPGNPPLAVADRATAGTDTWSIAAGGDVEHALAGGVAQRDPGAPALGRGAHLIAAPASTPGVVVAVSTDGTVWRRGRDGDWRVALLLLPAGGTRGAPALTALTAFARPLTDSVYLGTDGYAVLISTDGGDDWIRAGPGLPDSVRGLATDSTRRVLYAATSDGLWVHRLQSFPRPPVYSDAQLTQRWIGIALVVLLATALTTLAMRRLA